MPKKGGGKRKKKHKWRNGEGKALAEKLAADNADRQRERRTMGRAADDAGAPLFFVDTEAVGAGGLASSKKLMKRTAALKSQAILVPNSNITAIGGDATKHAAAASAQVAGKRKRTQEQLSRQTQKVLGKQRRKARNTAEGRGIDSIKVTKPLKPHYDLWGEELPDSEERGMPAKSKQVTYGQQAHGSHKANTRGRPSAGSLGTSRPVAAAAAAAVDVADPGASYNPDQEQHQELIGEALAQERETRRTEKQLKGMDYHRQRLLRPRRGEIADTDDMVVPPEQEESQALLTDRESVEAGLEVAAQEAVKPKGKLTVAQRNKQARVQQQEKELKDRREQKRQKQELNRLAAVEREVESIGQQRAELAEQRAAKREAKQKRTHRLGPHLYEESSLAAEVPLSDELGGGLRAAKLKGNLLGERLRSLQKRNIIEVRSTTAAHPSKHRRYKLKQYTTKAGRPVDAPDTIA